MPYVKLIRHAANPALGGQPPKLLNFSTIKRLNLFTIKRIIDFTAALLGMIILSPLLLVLTLLIAIKLGWPVFFLQVRPGRHGKPFKMIKFRTMSNDRDSEGNLLPNEQRKTKLGNLLRSYSLDELPELINVLKGDMSLVGPRPLLMEYLPRYNAFQKRRHEARPGITGWAQVNGRNAIGWEQKFEHDVWYVDHQSLWLDGKILWMTLIKVLKREGINSNDGGWTVPFFGSRKQVEEAGYNKQEERQGGIQEEKVEKENKK